MLAGAWDASMLAHSSPFPNPAAGVPCQRADYKVQQKDTDIRISVVEVASMLSTLRETLGLRAGGVAQLQECFTSMQQALGSILSTAKNQAPCTSL